MKIVILSKQQWDNRLKTIETKRLRKYKRALTATSMGHYFYDAIIEIYTDYPKPPSYLVNIDRYNELRVLFMNNSDDKLREIGVLPSRQQS